MCPFGEIDDVGAGCHGRILAGREEEFFDEVFGKVGGLAEGGYTLFDGLGIGFSFECFE